MDIMIDFNDKSEREGTHELLKQAIKEAGEQIKVECPTGTLKVLEKLIETQEKIIEEQEERIAIMTEGGLWIPVDERLPDAEKACYVTYYYQHPYAGEGYAVYQGFVALSRDGGWVDTDGEDFFGEITHWQYANIPEPPKEGEA